MDMAVMDGSMTAGSPFLSPFFTVLVPVHNRAATILPTLLSVRQQSFGDFECLVVDDGSDDGAALADVVAGLDDARFRLIARQNGGGGAARNSGIDAARGRYIAFLDSDDLFLPEKLAICRDALARDASRALYAQVLVDRGVGRLWPRPERAIGDGEDIGEYLFVHNQIIQTSSIVIATAAARATLFDPSLRKGQDLDFCLRLQRDGVCFRMLPCPLTIWTDVASVGRTSHLSGYAAPLAWLEKARPLLTRRAYLGYRATVLAYYMGRSRPLRCAFDLTRALVEARVAPRIIARQALRAYVPRDAYRRMVNMVVARRGQAAHQGSASLH